MFTWKNDWQTTVILAFVKYSLKREQREPVISRTHVFVAKDKKKKKKQTNKHFWVEGRIFKNFYQIPQPKEFSDETGGNMNKCVFKNIEPLNVSIFGRSI